MFNVTVYEKYLFGSCTTVLELKAVMGEYWYIKRFDYIDVVKLQEFVKEAKQAIEDRRREDRMRKVVVAEESEQADGQDTV